jgi:DNA-binding ferritin-like protein
MKGDMCFMDENTPVQNTNPREACLKLMNTLLASLTVFERNVKILHWNYQSADFVSVHPWLDDIHDDVCECIDAVAEEIRKGDFFPNATLTGCVEVSSIQQLDSEVAYSHDATFRALVNGLNSIRSLADMLSTMADENKFWTIQDMANDILKRMNHHTYFVKNTLTGTTED